MALRMAGRMENIPLALPSTVLQHLPNAFLFFSFSVWSNDFYLMFKRKLRIFFFYYRVLVKLNQPFPLKQYILIMQRSTDMKAKHRHKEQNFRFSHLTPFH